MSPEQPIDHPIKQRARAKLRRRKIRQPNSHPIRSGTMDNGPAGRADEPTTSNLQLPRKLLRWLKPEQFACLIWGLGETLQSSPEFQVAELIRVGLSKGKISKKATRTILDALRNLPAISPGSRFVHLAAGYSVGLLTGVGQSDCNWLVNQLYKAAEADDLDAEQSPLDWLWMQIELPLILGAAGSRLDESRLAQLKEQFSTFVEQTLTEEGWIPTGIFSDFLALQGSLLRCLLILKYLKQSVDERIGHRLEWMVRNVLRLVSSQGHQLLGDGNCRGIRGWAEVAQVVTEDRQDLRLIKAVRAERMSSARKLPEPSACCEASRTAVLRNGWDSRDCKAAWVIHDTEQLLQVDSREIWIHGPITPQISRNGKLLPALSGSIQLNCWHSDEDAEFLEWQTQMDEQVIWQRQLVLAKRDRLLFVGDVMLGGDSARWDYSCLIPTANGVEIETAADSRELTLRGRKSAVRVLPISLGEWKLDHTDDEIRILPNGFEIRQAQIGRCMMVGWVIDLDRRRAHKPVTWRHLTVAENLARTPRDRAVAFRFQSGKSQWLIYRSMTSNTSRSFLGQNVWSEFYFGRFSPDGTVESLVSVE